jgi:electron transfer flavoprotein alpha subunit
MAGEIWVVGEIQNGQLARVSGEVATLARRLGGQSGRGVTGVVVAAGPVLGPAAAELARFVPRVLAVTAPETADRPVAGVVAAYLAALVAREEPAYVLLGASPDGRDLAGALSALLGWGVLANAMDAAWTDAGPTVDLSIFGGRLFTTSGFTGDRGIVTVRTNAVTAEAAATPGAVEPTAITPAATLPVVRVVDRTSESGAAAPIEEARIIVAGGRGVAGPGGFGLVQELADELGGSVGATRAAVDAGWINYSHQIGQTGKIVKPALYLALGISGAIQHKVGMQTAETIVAVNRDPDAPLAQDADLYVVGDLFEVGAALLAALRARHG